ncbi:MAG: hypothetical protein IJD19_04830 [Ruminococcus sp.]|nr:hypothetical protein [Ruminococcus sp.]
MRNKDKREKKQRTAHQLDKFNIVDTDLGLRSDESMDVYTVALAVVSVVLAIFFFVGGAVLIGIGFLALAGLLVLSIWLSRKIVERINLKNIEKMQKQKTDSDRQEETNEKE